MSKKSILQKILAMMARATLRRYKPMIVGVTGSVGKTSTRLAIACVLAKKYRVGTAERNYNNEIGLPLAILGMRHCGRNPLRWGAAYAYAALKIMIRDSCYPDVLVLEYGIDRPGDMDYLLRIVRPDIAVVTAIGDIPAHIEFFRDAEELIEEKSKLVSSLTGNDPNEESTNPSDRKDLLTPAVFGNAQAKYAILNHDDEDVFEMHEQTKARVLTFGVGDHAMVRIMNYKFFIARDAGIGDAPKGIIFKLFHNGSEVPVRLDGVLGLQYTYAAAAAAAAGIAVGMNLVEISEALRGYRPPRGRMRLIHGNKHSLILDDTYNASPESMRVALETLEQIPRKRKIAVLGDMREIGTYTEQAHRTIGDRAAGFCDLLLCVGPAAKFIADEARAAGMAHDHILVFDDSREAGKKLDPLLGEGDVILVKGSQAVRMEKAVEEIMAKPEKAEELLVRQEEYW